VTFSQIKLVQSVRIEEGSRKISILDRTQNGALIMAENMQSHTGLVILQSIVIQTASAW
jgi:hypothetical protein